METLKVSFSKPTRFKIFAWLIMKVTKASFSHVSISWESTYLERKIIYQASGLAVNFMNENLFKQEHFVIKDYLIPMSQETKKKIIQFAMDNVGHPYGWKQCVGIGWVQLGKLLNKTWRNPFKDGRSSYVCCELVADILVEYFGMKFDKELDDLTPKDLLEHLDRINYQ